MNIGGPPKKGPPVAQLPSALVEITARIFCGMIGVDPEKEMQIPSSTIAGTFKTVKAWQAQAQHVGEAIVMNEAVFQGRSTYDAMVLEQKEAQAMKQFQDEAGAQFETHEGAFKDPIVHARFEAWVREKTAEWEKEHG